MILKSMPGIGRINLAALLSEGSGPLSRRDYPAFRTLCGAAPVTRRSGKSQVVIMRYAAHVRLRNTVYHWARVASQHDPRRPVVEDSFPMRLLSRQSPRRSYRADAQPPAARG